MFHSFCSWLRRLLDQIRLDDANREYFQATAKHWTVRPTPIRPQAPHYDR